MRIRTESALCVRDLIGGGAWERILVQTFCTRICIHCTPAAIDIITRGPPAERRGPRLSEWEVSLMRTDTGSRSTEHLPEFYRSRTFPVSALDQRSLPANQNTWARGFGGSYSAHREQLRRFYRGTSSSYTRDRAFEKQVFDQKNVFDFIWFMFTHLTDTFIRSMLHCANADGIA